MIRFLVVVVSSVVLSSGFESAWAQIAKTSAEKEVRPLLFADDFDRVESDDSKEQLGNGWGTNSGKRAKGNKQADLKEGALWITRHPEADHGVSVIKDVDFRDVRIEMRFRIGVGDDLGINLADMQEKTVHAGHLCVARIRLNKVEITDLKTGRMNLENRELKISGKLSDQQKKALNKKTKNIQVKLQADVWHKLVIDVRGDLMSVNIDGMDVGEFQSAGIAHPTKRRVRLAVGKSAAVDDLFIRGTP